MLVLASRDYSSSLLRNICRSKLVAINMLSSGACRPIGWRSHFSCSFWTLALPNNIRKGEVRVAVPLGLQVFTSIVFCRFLSYILPTTTGKGDILVKFLNQSSMCLQLFTIDIGSLAVRYIEQVACLWRFRPGDWRVCHGTVLGLVWGFRADTLISYFIYLYGWRPSELVIIMSREYFSDLLVIIPVP